VRGIFAATLVAAVVAASPVSAGGSGFEPVDVKVRAIAAFLPGTDETMFGALRFLGGVEIAAGGDFGGLSGIDFLPDGVTFVAVGDTGIWFTARLVENGDVPTGLVDARIAAMLGDDGKPVAAKAAGDAEGVRVVVHDGRAGVLVSFEQTARVSAFAGPDFAARTPRRVKLPGFVKGIRRNQGLEAIAVAPAAGPLAGATVVLAERSLDARNNHRGFVLAGPRAGEFFVVRSSDFDITDAAFLPDGDLLLLERRFSYSAGFAMRIRRIAAAAIRPGATVHGDTLIDADSRFEIDNMEGLAVRTRDDRTILTLISDDNRSMFQRTVLLQFELPAP
jgi:hypothetical protein